MLVYGTQLSATDRQAVEAYLTAKWLSNYGRLPAATPVSLAGVATLDLNGVSQKIASLADYGGSGGAVINSAAATPLTFTLNPASGSTTFSGTISDSGAANAISLVKNGAGTQVLSGTNTIAGTTTVNAGTLKINSPGSLTGTVTVNNGDILGGNGTVGSIVAASGGHVAPGASVGTLTTGTLSLASGSILDFEFGSGTNDQIAVTTSGGLTINGGGLNLYQDGTTNVFSSLGTYNLISYAGSLGGTGISALSVLNRDPTRKYSFGVAGGFVTLNIAVSPVWNAGGGADTNWSNAANWSGVALANGDSMFFASSPSGISTNNIAGGSYGGMFFNSGAPAFTLSGNAITLAGDGSGNVITNNSTSTQTINLPISLATAGQAVNAASGAIILSGDLSGAGGIVKTGANLLTLTGNNSYTGGTAVSAGTLKVSNPASLGAAGQTLTLNGGTLALATDSAVSSKNVTMGGNATLTLDRATAGSGFETVFGNFTSTGGDRTLTLTKGSNVTGGTAGLTFTGTWSSSGTTVTFDVPTDVLLTMSGGMAGGAQTVSLVKNGAGRMVLSGNYGTWDGGNAIALNAGTLDLRSIPGDSGNFRGVAAAAGTTLVLNRDTALNYYAGLTANGNMSVVLDRLTPGAGVTNTMGTLTSGAYTINISGTSNNTSGVAGLTFSGATTLNGNTTLNMVAPPAADIQVTLAGAVGGTGTLTKQGAGTLIFTGANTYSGATTISGGVLQVGAGGTSGTLGAGAVTNNASLVFNRSDALTAANAIGGTGSLTKQGAGTLTLGGANTYAGATTISQGTLRLAPLAAAPTGQWVADDLAGTTGTSVTSWPDRVAAKAAATGTTAPTLAAGTINGHNAVAFNGSNQSLQVATTTPMSNANDFTVAVVFRPAASGAGGDAQWYNNSGVVDMEQTGGTNDWGLAWNANNKVAAGLGNGDITQYSAAVALNTPHVAIYTRSGGVITLNVDGVATSRADGGTAARNNNRFTFGSLQTNLNYFNGQIAEVHTYDAVLNATQLSNLGYLLAGTYGVSASYVYTSATNYIPDGSAVSVAAGAVFDLNGNQERIGSLAGDAGSSVLLGAGTLTTGGNNADTTFAGAISGAGGSLVKAGSGIMTLSGSNSYSGTTTVSAGTLLVNGTHTGGGMYTVQSGGTLGGTGVISAPITVNAGGTLSPAASIGKLTVNGDVILGGTLKIEADGTGAGSVDLLDVTGLLDIANATVDFDVLAALNDPAYVFASYGTLGGQAFGTVIDLPASYRIDYDYLHQHQIALVPNDIPEPATMALLGLAAAGLGGYVRRRRAA